MYTVPRSTPDQNYYEILQITPSSLDSQKDPAQALKRAYHRALLIHHPDKRKQPASNTTRTSTSNPTSTITIDQISTAYAVLSSPSQRSEYDRLLLTQAALPSKSQQLDNRFQTGIENVDLDDLSFDEQRQEWFRGCRCGNPRGYRFGEADLEEAADFGEVMVGCADCSLWLRVHFAVVDDHEDEDGAGGTGEEEGSGGEKERRDGGA
ncbi:DnaJ-domain-containing protein [Coniochaeta ligniaria NRRL 30616]|uniref:Diphthamide biosynthesis protein 4 n=1 Tax=Coniochaeta ligniaria NRRL 30616 TaxID=1408157 RepID=A0A1J7K431_9PEZI|nr:DnaJ-domain-containing protein [Coniochaeta ligniaria NRRL 30616]